MNMGKRTFFRSSKLQYRMCLELSEKMRSLQVCIVVKENRKDRHHLYFEQISG